MSLPLVLRKNIRDTTPKLQEHLAAIQEVTGVEWMFEVDFGAVKAGLEAVKNVSYSDRLGEIIQDSYLSGLTANIKNFCKDMLLKEALLEGADKKVIRFTLVKEDPKAKETYYVRTRLNEGILEITVPDAKFAYNTAETGRDLMNSLKGAGPLSLEQRKNIADHVPKMTELLERLKNATGVEYDCEVDFPSVATLIKGTSYESRLGDIIYESYLGGLITNLENLCKDELAREAWLDKTNARKLIRIVVDATEAKNENRYQFTQFESDGTFVVHIPKSKFAYNTSETGRDVEKQL